MINQQQLLKISKYMSLVLRHKPEVANIKLDSEGWTNVDKLINNIKDKFDESFRIEDLIFIVQTDNKKRYSFKKDFTEIRANQGHSLKEVKITMEVKQPPRVLYHGTARRNLESIIKDGLNSGKRNHVHLSKDLETAINVAKRHSDDIVILEVASWSMYFQYRKTFYLSENNVWLCDYVDSKFITVKDQGE